MAVYPIKKRDEALKAVIEQMRENDEWHLFQDFCCRCLKHMGYTDVRLSKVRNDFGRDAVALDPEGKRCFVAVSFQCDKTKVLGDARRWSEDLNREPAEVMVFMTWDEGPQETTLSKWRGELSTKRKLKLRMVHDETLRATATNGNAWYEVCDLLGISLHDPAFTRVSPYDSEEVRGLLNVRPKEILSTPLPRRELGSRDVDRNCLIFGKPGAGKTTAIFLILERLAPETTFIVERDFREHSQAQRLVDALAETGGAVVFDDIQERPEAFRMFCETLLARRLSNVLVLAAVRSTEWDGVKGLLPPTHLEDLRLTGDAELHLGDLTLPECRSLVELCRDQWSLRMTDRLVDQAARCAVAGDASPLYVISLLAPVRGRADRLVTDTDLAGVPRDVVGLWGRYFDRLDAHRKAVLRLVKLFQAATTEPQRGLLDAAADRLGLPAFQVGEALEQLERELWVSRQGGAPHCLDVQLEAIPLGADDFEQWDAFVQQFDGARATHLSLLNGTGAYYAQVRRAKANSRDDCRRASESGLRHFEEALTISRDPEERAMFLNNASNLYSELASPETTAGRRRERVEMAIGYAEEAIGLYRALGLQADVAMSLNNASTLYSELASLETVAGRRGHLEKAIGYAEEAIELCRKQRLQENLAASLNNASTLYSELASLESTYEGPRGDIEKAAGCAEEAVELYRALGLQANVAMSLNNASTVYGALGFLATAGAETLAFCEKAAEASREAIDIFGRAGNPARFLTSLESGVRRWVELAGVSHEPIDERVVGWCEEGARTASQYGDRDRAEWFAAVKAAIERGETPEL